MDYNGNGNWDGCAIDRCYTFGMSTDLFVIRDWNYDGTDEIGVFRNGRWYLDTGGSGSWSGCSVDGCYYFGTIGDKPEAGNW